MKFQQWYKCDPPKNYFIVPNEVFHIDLSYPEISIYCYLLSIEARETYRLGSAGPGRGHPLAEAGGGKRKPLRRLPSGQRVSGGKHRQQGHHKSSGLVHQIGRGGKPVRPGFTLDTYTHITNDMQRGAAEKIGGFMETATAKPEPEPPDPPEESRCKVIPFERVG